MIQAAVRGWMARKPNGKPNGKPKTKKRKRVSFQDTVEDNTGVTRPLKRVNTSDFFKAVLDKGLSGVHAEEMTTLLNKVKQEDMTDRDAANDLIQAVQRKSCKLIDAMLEDKHVGITNYNISGGSTYVVDSMLRLARDTLIEV